MFCQFCYLRLEDFIKIVRLVFAALSVNACSGQNEEGKIISDSDLLILSKIPFRIRDIV